MLKSVKIIIIHYYSFVSLLVAFELPRWRAGYAKTVQDLKASPAAVPNFLLANSTALANELSIKTRTCPKTTSL